MTRVWGAALTVVVLLVACVGEDPDRVDGGNGTSSSSGGSGTDGGPDNTIPTDGSSTDAPASPCWSVRPANFDPCAPGFDLDHPEKAPKTVFAPVEVMNTDAAPDTLADGKYALYRYPSFVVNAGSKLTLEGSRPAIFVVAGDVTINGTIDVRTDEDPSCPDLSSGDTSTNCTAGGGGGGYGTAGGGGGNGPAGGPATGNELLSPLRAGCPGGGTGAPKPQSNGFNPGAGRAAGGKAGGALQISARGKIVISDTGSVLANGLGGGAGDGNPYDTGPCNTADDRSCTSGGGGGGSGGSILLEGAELTVAGQVCAVGGGGGGGGVEGGAKGGGGNTSASCAGAPESTGTAHGGAGGALEAPKSGKAESCGYTSSGGGGGAVGRIRLRATGTISKTGTIVPAAYAQ